MKKLSLDLDALKVESFSTALPERPRGTVNGYLYTYEPGCTDTTCQLSDAGAGCTAFNCGSGGGDSGWNTCGAGSGCELPYTDNDSCTNNVKHCGW